MENAVRKIGARLRELTIIHACVLCGQGFIPLLAMGERQCAFHPDGAQDGSTSSVRAMQIGLQSSRLLLNHYRCCGKVITHGVNRRDLAHEHYVELNGCTRCDHVSTRHWQSLVGIAKSTFHLSFHATETIGDRTNAEAQTWLMAMPIHYLRFLYYYRSLVARREGVVVPDIRDEEAYQAWQGRILGDEYFFFDRKEIIFGQSSATSRDHAPQYQLSAGGKKFIFDAKAVYLNMLFQFGFPAWLPNQVMNLQTHHVMDRPVHSTGPIICAGTQFKELCTSTTDDDDDELMAPPSCHHEPSKASNAVARLSSLLGLAPLSATTLSTTSSAVTQMHQQLFGSKRKRTAEEREQIRSDLYATDADAFIHSQQPASKSRAVETSTLPVTFLRSAATHMHHAETHARDYLTAFHQDYFDLFHGHQNDRNFPFLPFVVVTWMDAQPSPTNLIESDRPCRWTHDLTAHPLPW